MSLIPPYEFDLNIARKVTPLTIMYVMMLAFNNLCLQYVEVTFYQVCCIQIKLAPDLRIN